MRPRSCVRRPGGKTPNEELPAGRGIASPPDELGQAVDALIEHLASEAGIETQEAHEAIREGRVVETLQDRRWREMRQLLLIAGIGFLVQAMVLGFFYWLLWLRG